MNNPAFAKSETEFDAPPGVETEPEAESFVAPELQIPSAPTPPAATEGLMQPTAAEGFATEAEVLPPQQQPDPTAPIPVEAENADPSAPSPASSPGPMPDEPAAPPAEPAAAPAEPAAAPTEPAATRAETAPDSGPAGTTGSRARPVPRINIQAFCEDQRTAQVLQEASQDRRLSKAHVTVQMGGVEAASQFYRNAPTPNLIIIESLHRRDALLGDLARLAEVCDSGTKVVVIGHVNDVLLYRELLQRGVSEYLVMPLGVNHVMECISDLYTDPSAEPLGHVLAFVGAKGGVGSSTVCHNVAWAITEAVQSDVVIADFDLPFGTAGLDFNQDPVQGLADALSSPERIDEVLLDRLLSRCSDHLSLFAAPGTLEQSYDLSTSACDKVIDVLRSNVPYVAADLPHMWTEWARQVAIQADHVVITAMPDLANLRNAKNLMEKLVAARPNDAPPHLLLNQVGVAKRPEISAKDFADALGADVRFVIEFDAALFGTASNNGQMIEEVSSKSKAAEQLREVAMVLTDRAEVKAESPSLLAPILARLGMKKTGN